MMKLYKLYYKLCLGRVDIVSYIILFFICCFIDLFISQFTKVEVKLDYVIYYILTFILMTYIFVKVQVIEFRNSKNRCLRSYNGYNKVSDLPIYYKPEYKEYTKILKDCLDILKDKEVYNKFVSKGFIIVIEDRKNKRRFKNVAGYFDKFNKKIVLFTEGSFGKYSPKTFIEIFYHEFGHFIDYASGDISNNPDFLVIYKNYKDKVSNILNAFSYYDKNKYKNRKEFFAEHFSYFVLKKYLSEDLCLFFENYFI